MVQPVTMTWPQYAVLRSCNVGDREILLSPQETEFLCFLLMRYPMATHMPDLTEMMWPDPDLQPDTAWNIIRQLSHRINSKLGGRYVTSNRTGFHLLQSQQDQDRSPMDGRSNDNRRVSKIRTHPRCSECGRVTMKHTGRAPPKSYRV